MTKITITTTGMRRTMLTLEDQVLGFDWDRRGRDQLGDLMHRLQSRVPSPSPAFPTYTNTNTVACIWQSHNTSLRWRTKNALNYTVHQTSTQFYNAVHLNGVSKCGDECLRWLRDIQLMGVLDVLGVSHRHRNLKDLCLNWPLAYADQHFRSDSAKSRAVASVQTATLSWLL